MAGNWTRDWKLQFCCFNDCITEPRGKARQEARVMMSWNVSHMTGLVERQEMYWTCLLEISEDWGDVNRLLEIEHTFAYIFGMLISATLWVIYLLDIFSMLSVVEKISRNIKSTKCLANGRGSQPSCQQFLWQRSAYSLLHRLAIQR